MSAGTLGFRRPPSWMGPTLLVVWVAAGCQTTGIIPADQLRPHLSAEAVLMSVPRVAQTGANDCGLACLVALLRFHGLEPDEEAARRFSPARVGAGPIAAGELEAYLEERQFRVALVHGSLDHTYPTGLLALLETGLPVLVALAIGEGESPARHFVLVVGFDPAPGWVFVMDPARGVGAIPYRRFEEHWARADHLMLVAAPESRLGRVLKQEFMVCSKQTWKSSR